ncbi:monosaccharide ABC transporter membrane protein (CUT2 family) [Halanaerobium congolense]|jgi:ribose transport system permease protein|uniref:Monosaccharide ABC transporter membrane protein (CUT2 family) n=1 Tax=Halanaerobium congolense TaxID=54121 RepID=A0A4R8GBZ0_9FIRM|nr:ABC transporter permease [Halanaerobium congolense]TDX42892.1 monosaccharide ABC transporter membrane protein (CUT2 family) [Halanaerobium congolense]
MQSKIKGRFRFDWQQNIVFIAFAFVFIFFAITLYKDGFLSVFNIANIFRQTAIISVMAIGMTFVISAGEIDLSVGSITALSALSTALVLDAGLGIIIALIVGLATGMFFGVVNGFFVSQIGIPSFLVTLGMMGTIRGTAMWLTDTKPIPILNDTYNFWFGSGNIGLIPILFFWMILIGLIGYVVYNKTTFGRHTLAVGGNEKAAKYTGVKTSLIKFKVMALSGLMAGLAGMLYAGRMQSGRYTFGEGDELSVIAAVILGGTSLFGGMGTIIGTLVGALLMGVINNGLIIAGLDVSQQMIIRGLIIILAVALGKKK